MPEVQSCTASGSDGSLWEITLNEKFDLTPYRRRLRLFLRMQEEFYACKSSSTQKLIKHVRHVCHMSNFIERETRFGAAKRECYWQCNGPYCVVGNYPGVTRNNIKLVFAMSSLCKDGSYRDFCSSTCRQNFARQNPELLDL